MKFSEAKAILSKAKDLQPLSLALNSSGETGTLELYLEAAFAESGYDLDLDTAAFGTLQQSLRSQKTQDTEVVIACPWDFCQALDWRKGIPRVSLNEESAVEEIQSFSELLIQRKARVLYLPAPLPPVTTDCQRTQRLAAIIESECHRLNATVLPSHWFSLASYLSAGSPFTGKNAGDLARKVAHTVCHFSKPSKLLISDLDNVMWRGVIGEDTLSGIACNDQGAGFIHHIYQTFLQRLKSEGVLLAVVSRNDMDLATQPFSAGLTELVQDDFVSFSASYHSKSGQISQLLETLNLSADQSVFVDDNPLEIAEVELGVPGIKAVQFPASESGFVEMTNQLSNLFHRPGDSKISVEDRNRTAYYKTRLAELRERPGAGADLSSYLASLDMTLIIHDRTQGPHDRAIQLINKTTQFNINGEPLSMASLAQAIDKGSRLFTASLRDRHGEHGEIAACVINRAHEVTTFVLSCRVFQRRVEDAIVRFLFEETQASSLTFHFVETERNTPARRFLASESFTADPASPYVLRPNPTWLEQDDIISVSKSA